MFTDIFNTVFLQMSENVQNDLKPNIANKTYLSVLFQKKKIRMFKERL